MPVGRTRLHVHEWAAYAAALASDLLGSGIDVAYGDTRPVREMVEHIGASLGSGVPPWLRSARGRSTAGPLAGASTRRPTRQGCLWRTDAGPVVRHDSLAGTRHVFHRLFSGRRARDQSREHDLRDDASRMP